MESRSVLIEGDLDYQSESSSSSEEDYETCEPGNSSPVHRVIGLEDSDEEEVEVFGEQKIVVEKKSRAAISQPQPQPQPQPPIASLTPSILPTPPQDPVNASARMPDLLVEGAAPQQEVEEEEDDEFSVLALPPHPPAASVNILPPAPPADAVGVDEASLVDFSQELQEIERERVQAEQLQAPAVEGLAGDQQGWGWSHGAGLGAEEPVAAAALREVSEVYAQGLGDLEVRLLGDHPAAPAPALGAGAPAQLRGAPLAAIDERDEDEEDEAEDSATAPAPTLGGLAPHSSAVDAWAALDAHAPTDAEPQREPQREAEGEREAEGGGAPLSFAALLRQLQEQEEPAGGLARFLGAIRVSEDEDPGGGGGVFSALFRRPPPALCVPEAEQQLRLPFLLAQLDVDPSRALHLQVLRQLHAQLTGAAASPPLQARDARYEQLGFQGHDPRSDLNRSMKMLAPLLLLRLLEERRQLARALFHLSQSDQPQPPRAAGAGPDTSWPFALVCIHMTKLSLQLLRRRQLHKLSNQKGSVLDALFACFAALLVDFGRRCAQSPEVHHALHLSALSQEVAQRRLLKEALARCAQSEALLLQGPDGPA
eukprot:gene31129-37621_t